MKRTELKRGKPLARGKPMKRTAQPRARSGLPAKQRKPLPKMSARRKAALPELARSREIVRERSGGWCELQTPVCVKIGRVPHHLAGRDGDRLTDPELQAWTCDPCHRLAHSEPALSYKMGWMIRRTTKRGDDG